LSEKGEYKNNKMDGPYVRYYKDGQLRKKGAYKNGKRVGRWVYYDTAGNLNSDRSGVYKDGVKISD